uniref:Amino acid transporter transmembrane domain-containing protein n=1 Tax=Latimeria chalumnae TaxID=7897 RepID=H3AS47_LATCH
MFRDEDSCWGPVTKINAYRIFLAGFVLLIGPFAFFSIQKIKLVQIFIAIISFLVFFVIFVVTFDILAKGHGNGKPNMLNFEALPNLFGACLMAAASHITLPNVIPPIQEKAHLNIGIMCVFVTVASFYAMLSVTVIFTFENDKIQPVVLLNFSDCSIIPILFFLYFLGLYTTFKVSAVFPLNAVTLRDNLKAMFSHLQCSRVWVVERLVFPLVAIIPPVVIALATHNIEMIVGVTGSYAVTVIQFVIPPLLVYFSRKNAREMFGKDVQIGHASPFQHIFWIVLTLIFAAFILTVVTKMANKISGSARH